MHSMTAPRLHRAGAGAAELQGAESGRRFGTWFGSRPRTMTRGERLVIERRDASSIADYGARAAGPRVAMYDLGDVWRIRVDAPGATAKNTSVVWDAKAETLVVAVWCGTPPNDVRRSFPRPEVAWLRRFRLPTAEFSRAEASVHRGVSTVKAPKRIPPRPSWEPAHSAGR